jgi:hypothetical protein
VATSEPIACTLTTKDAAGQALEWVDLQGVATAVAPLPDGARMTFPASLRAQVEDLADRERTCCTFLTITTETVDGTLVLDVTSENPEGRPVIAVLAGLGQG